MPDLAFKHYPSALVAAPDTDEHGMRMRLKNAFAFPFTRTAMMYAPACVRHGRRPATWPYKPAMSMTNR